MGDNIKGFLCSLLIFGWGFSSGYMINYDRSVSPSLTDLQIERTQLEIKILKGQCKPTT